jgi:c-di-GMP-binding flagellar brake protein YcgR
MIPIRKSDIALGRPLPWPVFDGDRRLLLRAGFTIETVAQLDELGRRGLYRAVASGADAAVPDDEPAARGPDGKGEVWRSLRFEELRLPLLAPLTLQKLDPDDDTRYAARLHGVFRDTSIVVNIPAPGGGLAMFRQGQPLLVRAFSGTNAFAFTANVLTIRYAPAAYLHLEYPKSVDGTAIRSTQRVTVRLIASATPIADDGSDGASLPAQVADLSSGGARLVVRQSLGDAGGSVILAFRLRTQVGEATLKLRGAIRRTEPDENGGGVSHGVQFVDLEPLDVLALEGYIACAAATRDPD